MQRVPATGGLGGGWRHLPYLIVSWARLVIAVIFDGCWRWWRGHWTQFLHNARAWDLEEGKRLGYISDGLDKTIFLTEIEYAQYAIWNGNAA